jgi:hypothetical protein
MENMMKIKLLALAITTATLFASTQAKADVTLSFASDVTIDLSVFGNAANFFDAAPFPGPWGNGDADDVTAKFDDFGFTGMWATSIYDMNDGSVLGSFFDTNVSSELAAYGVPGTYPSLADGLTNPVSLVMPTAPGQTNIDSLNPITDTAIGGTSDDEGYGTSWYFTTEFHIDGTLGATLPDYTGGYFDIVFNSAIGGLVTSEKVLTANFNRDSVVVDGTATSAASSQIWFNITSAKAGLFTTYNSSGVGSDLSTLAGMAGPEFRLAFNTDPAVPTPESLAYIDSSLYAGIDDGLGLTAIRQTTLDGSGQLPNNVPEPGSLALIGLGLLGLASRKVKR